MDLEMRLEMDLESPGSSPNPPPPRRFSGLDVLPLELQIQIIEALLPKPPEIGETKPVAFNQLLHDEPWYAFTRNRQALRNLCLVSRTVEKIARPLLYRVVAIVDEDMMLLFLRTLIERREYGAHVRFLSCHLTLTSDLVYPQVLESCTKIFQTVSRSALAQNPTEDLNCLFSLGAEATKRRLRYWEQEEVPQLVLAAILSCVTELEALLLQIPLSKNHVDYDMLIDMFRSPRRAMRRQSLDAGTVDPLEQAAVGVNEGRAEGPLCPNLTTLMLQCDAEYLFKLQTDRRNYPHNYHEDIGARPGYYASIFALCPKLSTMEFSGDDGLWLHDDLRETMAIPSSIDTMRQLYFHDSLCTPKDACDILAFFPCLETLYLIAEHVDSPEVDPLEVPEVLNESLAKFGRSLRHLDLGWWDCRRCLTEIGEESTLTCLRELPRIETLAIQLSLLYKSHEAADLVSDLVDLLPPTLTDLTLEEWWWEFSDLEGASETKTRVMLLEDPRMDAYAARLQALMMGFALRCSDLPALRKVCYLPRMPMAWAISGPPTPHWGLRSVAMEFERKGVEFFVGDV